MKAARENPQAISAEDRKRVDVYIAPTGIVVDTFPGDEEAYDNALAEINRVRTSQVAKFAAAAKYLQKRISITSTFPLVGVMQRSPNVKEMARLRKPISLTDKSSKDESGHIIAKPGPAIALGPFSRINFARALEIRRETLPTATMRDVTAGDLRQTVSKRKAKSDTGEQTDKLGKDVPIRIVSANQAESYVSALGLFFGDDTRETWSKDMSDTSASLSANDATERVKLYGDSLVAFSRFFAPFQPAYDTIMKSEQAESAKRALDKANKRKAG